MLLRIRELRIDNDMSQQEVANLLGMSQTGYSKYETGDVTPPAEILVKLAKLYNTSVDYLLGVTREKKPYK